MRWCTGSVSNALRSIVDETSDDVIWTSGDSPATVIVSWMVESFIGTLITARWPALKVRLLRSWVEKPVSSTVIS